MAAKLKDSGFRWNMPLGAWVIPASAKSAALAESLANGSISQEIRALLPGGGGKLLRFKTEPRKHQVHIVDFFKERERIVAACGTGTGKSKAAIDSATSVGSNILVFSPKACANNFADEVRKHSDCDPVVVAGTIAKRREILNSGLYDFYIINYEAASKLVDELVAMKPDAVILDELHYLKNHRSARFKALRKITKNIRYKIGLTGTFITNSIKDAYAQQLIIDDKIFGKNYNNFQNEFLVMGGFYRKGRPVQITGYKNQEKFRVLMARNTIRYDIDDIVDLPEVVEYSVNYELSPKSRAIYDDMSAGFHETVDVESSMAQMIYLQTICSGHIAGESIGEEKMKAIVELIDGLDGKKCVVWFKYSLSIDIIAKLLHNSGVNFAIYDGRANDAEITKDFESGEETTVLLSNIAMGIGWETPSAKYQIFAEHSWERSRVVQAKGRSRRLTGSENGACVYISMVAKDTMEERICETTKKRDFEAADALGYVAGGKGAEDGRRVA
jgi:SNF2 family DNA or RNA helicase